MSIGLAIAQYMSTPVNAHEAETFLAVFIALAEAEKDVSLILFWIQLFQTIFIFQLYGIVKAMEFNPDSYSSVVACQPLVQKIQTNFQAV
jgi:hypothetical protein